MACLKNSKISDLVLRLGPLHVFTAASAFTCHQSLFHMQWHSTCLVHGMITETGHRVIIWNMDSKPQSAAHG